LSSSLLSAFVIFDQRREVAQLIAGGALRFGVGGRGRFGSFAAHANVRLEVEHCRAELDTVARAQRVLGHQEVVHERAVEAADIAQESLRSAAPELAVAAGQARIVQPERVFRSTAGARRIILQLEDAVPVPTLDDQLRQGSPPVYPQAGQRTAGC